MIQLKQRNNPEHRQTCDYGWVLVGLRVCTRHWLSGVFLVCSIVSSPLFAQSLNAEVNRSQLSVDESLVLTIVADGITGQPQLSPLSRDFEVVGTSTRREVKIIQGVMNDLQSWEIEMIPKRTGDLEIPSLTLQGFASNALTVRVTEAASAQQQAKGSVFLEVNIDNSSPMLQAQVIYTVRFYSAVRIVDGEMSEPDSEKLTVRRLGDDTGYFQQRNGRRYRVVERRYAIFPRESGEITIPPLTMRVNVPDNNNSTSSIVGRVKRLTRRSPAITLNVRAKPAADSGAWWLAAKSLSLTAEWEGDGQEFRVGEPLTRTLTLEVDGATGEQLPELEPLQVPGLKVYADKPEIVEQPVAESLVARRIDKWAIIPQTAGELTLPAVEVSWFDTVSETYRVASVPSQVINVLPQVQSSSTTPGDAQVANAGDVSGKSTGQDGGAANTDNNQVGQQMDSGNTVAGLDQAQGNLSAGQSYWKTLALAAIAAWILSSAAALWLWWRSRGGRRATANSQTDNQQRESTKAALREVDKSVKTSDSAAGIAAAVLAWAARQWPQSPPQSLQDLALHYPAGSPLKNQLDELDRLAYGRDSRTANSAGESLRSRFSTLPQLIRRHASQGKKSKATKTPQLPEL